MAPFWRAGSASATGGGWSAGGSVRERGREPPGGFLDVLGAARKAQTEIALSTGPERRAGRDAHIGLVDETQRHAARVGLALDGEEQVERARGLGEVDPPGRGEPLADDV